MMWNDGWGMGAGGVIWIVVIVAALALIVVGIVLLVRGLSGRPDHGHAGHPLGPPPEEAGPNTALRILEERYARGEIDHDEFLGRKQDLLGA